jgi:hypothetical protein
MAPLVGNSELVTTGKLRVSRLCVRFTGQEQTLCVRFTAQEQTESRGVGIERFAP